MGSGASVIGHGRGGLVRPDDVVFIWDAIGGNYEVAAWGSSVLGHYDEEFSSSDDDSSIEGAAFLAFMRHHAVDNEIMEEEEEEEESSLESHEEDEPNIFALQHGLIRRRGRRGGGGGGGGGDFDPTDYEGFVPVIYEPRAIEVEAEVDSDHMIYEPE